MPSSCTTRLIYYFVIRHRKKGKRMYVFVFALCTGTSLNLTYCFYAYLTYVLCVIMRNHGIKFAAVLLLLTLCTFGLHHEKIFFVLVSANRDDIWENIQLLCIGQNIMQFKLCKIWRHVKIIFSGIWISIIKSRRSFFFTRSVRILARLQLFIEPRPSNNYISHSIGWIFTKLPITIVQSLLKITSFFWKNVFWNKHTNTNSGVWNNNE